MTDKEEESLARAVSTMVYYYLVEKTNRRVSGGAAELNAGQAPENATPDFLKAWQSIASDLYYRLRSARTKRLFADCFTQTICSIPQGKLNRHLDTIADMMRHDQKWEELRDLTMLSLSAKAFRRDPQHSER